MIWFTADLHFGHEAVIKMQNRPFKNSGDMDNALIHNINECVAPKDTLYILGDVSHHITPEETNVLIKRLHGKKYLLLGNHDVIGEPEQCQYDMSLFESVDYYKKINAYNLNIVMMHYPMLTWPKTLAGSVMLHGHVHSGLEYNAANIRAGIRRYDVGVDANNYYPVSIEQVKYWAERTPVSITSRENLYLSGVWTADAVSLGVEEETLRKADGKCLIRPYERESGDTAYMSFIPGKYSEDMDPWDKDDLCVDIYVWSALYLDGLFGFVPGYDFYGITAVDKSQWETICGAANAVSQKWRDFIDQLRPWVEEVFKNHDTFTIWGQ